MVYNDHFESLEPKLQEAIQRDDITRVSPNYETDIKFDMNVWTGFYSSNTATWFACWMGCDPVILCGMDLYQGDRAYFHKYEDKPQFHLPLDHHLQPWVEDARNLLPHPERVKAMSGPLVNIFGAYEGSYETIPEQMDA